MTTSRRPPPQFDDEFREKLGELIRWRRDVRRFKTDPVKPELIEKLVQLATCSPSVGHSQPWRFVLVEDADRRRAIQESFARANSQALKVYTGEQQDLYARLKLEGLKAAPVQLAVFADEATVAGSGLGQQTMPETLRYSVVAAIQTLWLGARAHGLGVGWISILEPDVVTSILNVPRDWRLIAYLCVGWPEEEHLDRELERAGWQEEIEAAATIVRR
jgi:5,6-dimethylbenzimidazole synthase